MAEMTTACCSTDSQETCCEPADKGACCGESAGDASCGCAEGGEDVRAEVRERYAVAARAASAADPADLPGASAAAPFGASLYGDISARRVGPGGEAIGLDMTPEMLALARRNAAAAGVANARFLEGEIERIPLPDASVDIVISNCVINLSADKPRVLREVARVLRPGGRLAVSDVVADEDMDAATRSDMDAWTGCIAGALTRASYEAALSGAGLEELEIRETHRVHAHAGSAIIRARKPA